MNFTKVLLFFFFFDTACICGRDLGNWRQVTGYRLCCEGHDFRYNKFEIRIRLYDEWRDILKKDNLIANFYGD